MRRGRDCRWCKAPRMSKVQSRSGMAAADSLRIVVKYVEHSLGSQSFSIEFAVTHGNDTVNLGFDGERFDAPKYYADTDGTQAMLDDAWAHVAPRVNTWLRLKLLKARVGTEYVPPSRRQASAPKASAVDNTTSVVLERYRAFVREHVTTRGRPSHRELARAIEDDKVDLQAVHTMMSGFVELPV